MPLSLSYSSIAFSGTTRHESNHHAHPSINQSITNRHNTSHYLLQYRYSDGTAYEGLFKDGLREGEGTLRRVQQEGEEEAARGVGGGGSVVSQLGTNSVVGGDDESLGGVDNTTTNTNTNNNNNNINDGADDLDPDVIYEGTWHADKYSGEGVLVYANGDRYTGSFENGLRHGTGALIPATPAGTRCVSIRAPPLSLFLSIIFQHCMT
jgi:hypothetical protein